MLQRGYMVAMSRLYDMASPEAANPRCCTGCMPCAIPTARARSSMRYGIPGSRLDFTDAAGELLRWA